ncbi:uncharacterized protein SPPG_09199 [Spizellomyces punctatus DAOM BR117]|uniref:Uncharacterized protein n=1 Tax=Spizellomyces punctatus (strain DAOM BR117) TaxID=645134 RepID=A0A0L0HGM1_SPIPD|nr:uncharacterized protein SPPG_09199 [Spizellomyces punctatus DAOM BR117]KND00192.1 hypothetical protein SPPG_09199 [Spizellomyces punctatus DAOM BR117]|eukprot:XP_016608231.1 hypothetical protein SPPG_09199 [Spizellomyces punctatus DAOM BR117]
MIKCLRVNRPMVRCRLPSLRRHPQSLFSTTVRSPFLSSFFSRPKPSHPSESTSIEMADSSSYPSSTAHTPLASDSTENGDVSPCMSARDKNMSPFLEKDREYLEKLLEREGGISGVELEDGEPVGLKRQVKADMKRVI